MIHITKSYRFYSIFKPIVNKTAGIEIDENKVNTDNEYAEKTTD